MIRRFHLLREKDETGQSGLGKITEGCIFSNGWVAMVWLTSVTSLSWYLSIEDVERIHGHNGATKVVFED